MKLKKILNAILVLEIIWVLAISETSDLRLLMWTIVMMGYTLLARVNHKQIYHFFFQEKEKAMRLLAILFGIEILLIIIPRLTNIGSTINYTKMYADILEKLLWSSYKVNDFFSLFLR